MSKRRVGGSGWAGVYGSFIGLAKATTESSAGRRVTKKKAAPKVTDDLFLASSVVELALQSTDTTIVQAARRVRAVQADVEAARQRLQALNSQLLVLHSSLSRELARVNAAVAPVPDKGLLKRLKSQ